MLATIITALSLSAMVNATPYQNQDVASNAKSMTQKVAVSNHNEGVNEFHTIHLNLNVNVMIVAGDETEVLFDGNTETADLIDINVENNLLTIGVKDGDIKGFNSQVGEEDFTIIITMSELKGIVINGNGIVNCREEVMTKNLEVEINGAGEVHTENLDVLVPKESTTVKKTI